MPFGFIPVNHPPAVVSVDLPINGASDCTPVLNSCRFDSLKDAIELFFLYTKAVMLDGERLLCFDEIKSQSVVDVNSKEWSVSRLGTAHLTPRRSAKSFAEASLLCDDTMT
jgi:hypothetical protein